MSSSDAIADFYQALSDIAGELEGLERKVQEIQRAVSDFPTKSEGLFADDLGPAEHRERILDEARAFVAQLSRTLSQAHMPGNDARNSIARLGAEGDSTGH